MKKFNKKYLFGIAIVALCVGLVFPINAANSIEDRDCSLTINVENTDYGTDLKDTDIHVQIYKIADMALTGAFTSTQDFKKLKIEDMESGQEDWEKTAKQAEKIIENKDVKATKTLTFNESGTFSELSRGLYLVKTDDAQTDEYEYTFTPFIISLPNNYYYKTKDVKDDVWVYDVTSALKPERSDRYGKLKITKTLNEFNASLKQTTFVFSVEATKDGETVYSNVVSTTFDSTGSKEVLLDDIPVGSTVTVTEVYSGASYTLASDSSTTCTIVADETMEADFTNTYNDELKPGYGVTNHFEMSDGEWTWSQLTDNTQQ